MNTAERKRMVWPLVSSQMLSIGEVPELASSFWLRLMRVLRAMALLRSTSLSSEPPTERMSSDLGMRLISRIVDSIEETWSLKSERL